MSFCCYCLRSVAEMNSQVLHVQMSSSLGFGFRCGFLGLLHMDIVRERLEREYDLDLIITAPSVVYHAVMEDGEVIPVQNPSMMPEAGKRRRIEEPYVKYVFCLSSLQQSPIRMRLKLASSSTSALCQLPHFLSSARQLAQHCNLHAELCSSKQQQQQQQQQQQLSLPDTTPCTYSTLSSAIIALITAGGCRMEMITPKDYVGALIQLSENRRGDFVDMQFLTEARTTLVYNIPLAEVSWALLHTADCQQIMQQAAGVGA